MALFGKVAGFEDAITTMATIERVAVTWFANRGENQADAQCVFLTLRYPDDLGAVVTSHCRLMIRFRDIPMPGGVAVIAYKSGRLQYHSESLQPPDPATPRGWGAGIFEVDDLGGHHSRSRFWSRRIDRQRELFRTGRQEIAKVVSVSAPSWRMRGVRQHIFVLRVDSTDFEVEAWAPPVCVPRHGDLIKIAVNDTGRDVALDSDERYEGPPGQALVFTTPPEAAARRANEPVERWR